MPGNLLGITFLFLNNPFECRTWFISMVISPEDFLIRNGTSTTNITVGFEYKWMVIFELFVHFYEWSYVFFFVMPTFGFLCSTHDWVEKIK